MARLQGIQGAVDQLVSAAGAKLVGDDEGLVYLGLWNEAYPAILIRDKALSDSAKVQYLFLCQEARTKRYGAIAIPSIRETAKVLGQSSGTVIRDRLLLRLTRWISLCQRAKDSIGRARGNVLAIHGEPCALSEATELDREYMRLVEELAMSHKNARVRRTALSVSRTIDLDLRDGIDPLGPKDVSSQRIEAAQASVSGKGRFYAIALECLDDDLTTVTEETTAVRNLKQGLDTSVQSVSDSTRAPENFTPSVSHLTHSLGTSADSVSHLKRNTSHSGDSVSDEKHRLATSEDSVSNLKHQTSQFSPDTQFETGNINQNHPKTGETLAFPPDSTFETGHSDAVRSSSMYIKTTTTETSSKKKTNAPQDPHWPNDVDDNIRRMVLRAIQTRESSLSDKQRLDVLNTMIHRVANNKGDPVNNPFSYTLALCAHAAAGTLNAIPLVPNLNPGNGNSTVPREVSSEVRELRSEIQTLKNLSRAPNPQGVKDQFSRQIAEHEKRLAALCAEYGLENRPISPPGLPGSHRRNNVSSQ